MFNPDVIAAVKAAKFCRVVIYPPVRGWCRARRRSKWRRRLLCWAKYSSNQVIDGKQVWHYRIELPPTTEAVAAKAVAA